MEKQHLLAKYSQLSYEDFLQDEFFISSKSNPNSDYIEFWLDYERNSPENITDYRNAVATITHIRTNTKELNYTDKQDLWNSIEQSNAQRTRKQKRKQLYRIVGTIAACAIALTIALPQIFKPYLSDDDIIRFAEKQKKDYSMQANVQLILSEKKTIELEAKESQISYDSIDIKISGQEISKKESAVYNQLLVPKGKRSQLTLADGSRLHINSGTRVIYPIEFATDCREIYVDGEAYIDVVKDSKRPFVVKTNDISIEVLGTSFNLMAYEGDNVKQVVLVEGLVKVLNADKKSISITPDNMYQIKDGVESVVKVETGQYTSWLRGIHHYRSETLESIIRRLSRYYGVNITCEDNVKNFICSGKIDIDESFDKILSDITYVLPITINSSNNQYLISKDN